MSKRLSEKTDVDWRAIRDRMIDIGLVCPHCNSVNVTKTYDGVMRCDDCGKQWKPKDYERTTPAYNP